MRTGTHHTAETREKISRETKKRMMKPETRAKILKTAFKKGQTPWNKGKHDFRPSKATEFKEGELVGEGHPSWKGGVQKPKDDCVHLWNGANKRVRRPRLIYEKEHGKIPKGFVIWHIDGDKKNDDISNLEAISRAEMMKRNFKYRWQ